MQAHSSLTPAEPTVDELLHYAATSSDASRNQMVLNALAKAADARRDALDSIKEWVGREAEARAIELIRHMLQQVRSGKIKKPKRTPHPIKPTLRLPEKLPDQLALEPFFCDRETANALLKALPVNQRRKWAAFYQAYGCLLCGTKRQPHASSGMCSRCRGRVQARLKRVLTPAGQESKSKRRKSNK